MEADPQKGSAFLFITNSLGYICKVLCENVENKIVLTHIFFINFFCSEDERAIL